MSSSLATRTNTYFSEHTRFVGVVRNRLVAMVNGSNSTSKTTIEVSHSNMGFESPSVRQGASRSKVKAFQ